MRSSRRKVGRIPLSGNSRRAEAALLLPAAGLLAFFIYLPAANAGYHAFTAWLPGYGSPWVGLANFSALLNDPLFHTVVRNEFVFLLGVPLWLGLPLLLSLLLYERVPYAGLFRMILFFPVILPIASIGILFRAVLAPDGLINSLLGDMGLHGLERQWLNDPGLVKPVLICVIAWSGMGLGVLIFSAALSTIPPEYFEAAELEGASWWARLRHVMLPGIRNSIGAYFILQVISAFIALFPLIYVLSLGGPGYSSTTMDYQMYLSAFVDGDFAKMAAESVILVAIVVAVTGAALVIANSGGRLQRVATGLGRLLPRLPSRARVPATARLVGLAPAVGGVSAATQTTPRDRARAKVRRRRLRSSRTRSLPRLVGASVFAGIVLVPLIYLVFTATKTTNDYLHNPIGIPHHVTFDHLSKAWTDGDLGRGMVNSFIAVTVGVAISVVVCTTAAFWLVRHRGSLARLITGSIFLAWLVPPLVYLLPLYIILANLGLTNSLIVLGAVYATFNLPFGIFLMWSYFREGLPVEILQAAEMDGASLGQAFRWIVVPLARPMLGALIAISFVFMWGDLILALVLIQDPAKLTVVPLAAGLVTNYDPAIQESAAASLILMVPMALVFAISQRSIVRGITQGVGK